MSACKYASQTPFRQAGYATPDLNDSTIYGVGAEVTTFSCAYTYLEQAVTNGRENLPRRINSGLCPRGFQRKMALVGDHGVEPCTSSLSEKRSTDELATQYSL